MPVPICQNINGVWRGKASKGGASRAVSIDFQGNVNAAK